MIMSPDPVINANIAAGKGEVMPFFKTNKRLHKAMITYLNNNGKLEGSEVAERIKWVEQHVDYIYGISSAPPQDNFDSPSMFTWLSHLQKHGAAATAVQSLQRNSMNKYNSALYNPLVTMTNRIKGIQNKMGFKKAEVYLGDGMTANGLRFWTSPNNVSKYIATAKENAPDHLKARDGVCR